MKPLTKDPLVIGAIVLISILVVGVVVAALLVTPFSNVNIEQTYQDDTINVNQLNLDFESDSAQVNVFTQNSNGNNFVVSISGSASKGIFGGDAGSPVKVTLYNDTVNGVQTVKAKLEESTAFSRYNVVCNIYVNLALTLTLNITSQTGQVNLTSDKPATFESINLKASAGTVGANLQNVTVAGNVTLGTQAGTVHFRASQVIVKGNSTVDLHSNSGSINMDITQTKAFQGNLQVNAVTGFGSVNVGLTIDGDIRSQNHLANKPRKHSY